MKPASAVAIYLLFWAITLFVVLPFGVRTADEAGQSKVPGQADSAPMHPMLARKFLWTTALATALFALFMANYYQGWIRLEDIPGWHHRGPYQPGT